MAENPQAAIDALAMQPVTATRAGSRAAGGVARLPHQVCNATERLTSIKEARAVRVYTGFV